MKNEIKTSNQSITKLYPMHKTSIDVASKYVNLNKPDKKRRVIRNSNFEYVTAGKELIEEMEATQLETERYEVLDVFKITSDQNNTQRKLSLFIDIPKLESKLIDNKIKPDQLFFNSKFIATYLRLSQREKQVLKQLSFMKTSEEIASILFISCNTVKNHRKNIRQKLEFDSREESSRFLYWVRGFVSLPSGF